jgi:hypothetical protein
VIIQPALDIIHYRTFPDYRAVHFPSNQNTIEVFRLKVATAEPAAWINKLFAGTTELPK